MTYEQCRRLHERLRDDGGVLYAARDRFPKQIRGQRLGLRPTPRQASDQSQQLDAWLQLLTRRTDDLLPACQKAVRSFPWNSTRKVLDDGRPGARAEPGRGPPQRRVYPLGDPQSLPLEINQCVGDDVAALVPSSSEEPHRHAIEQVCVDGVEADASIPTQVAARRRRGAAASTACGTARGSPACSY